MLRWCQRSWSLIAGVLRVVGWRCLRVLLLGLLIPILCRRLLRWRLSLRICGLLILRCRRLLGGRSLSVSRLLRLTLPPRGLRSSWRHWCLRRLLRSRWRYEHLVWPLLGLTRL